MKKKCSLHATITYALLLLCISCDSKSKDEVGPSQNNDSREAVAEPGYGLPTCHLGMSIDKLTGKWQSERQLFPDDDHLEIDKDRPVLYNVEQGIFLGHRDRKVHSIQLVYREPGYPYANFLGKTKEGIGKSSSIRDVFMAYGEPDSISHTHEHDAELDFKRTGRMNVSLYYHTKGAYFLFTGGKINSIDIVQKQSLPIDPVMAGDVGDTRELWEMAREVSREKAEARGEQ